MRISAHTTSLFVGVTGRVNVEVEVTKETRVDFIRARIFLFEGWVIGSGKSQVSHSYDQLLVDLRLMDDGVLPRGVTHFGFDVLLPPGTPPSHGIAAGYARTELRVHVSVPWRIDGRERFDLMVRLPPGAPVAPTPGAWRSSAVEDGPRLELGLASTRIAVGDVLVGSCAVFHMDDRAPREVAIAITPTSILGGRGRLRTRTGDGFGIRLVLPPGSHGVAFPFRVQLPSGIPPSFSSVTHALSWNVTARTGSLFGAKAVVAAPVVLVDQIAADATSRYAQPPALTDERVAGVLARFASQRGWRSVTDRATRAISIACAEGPAELQLSYVHRGTDGTFLVARIVHPSLGLGLSVAPSSLFHHLFLADLEVGIPEWDRTHVAHARFATQALPVLAAVVPALLAVTWLGALVRWTDDAIVFERKVVAVGAQDLDAASTSLLRVATAIAAGRELATVPPGCEVDVDAWRALARSLHGQLALGDLSISGTLDAAPVHLGLDYDDDAVPVSVHARIGDPQLCGELARAVAVSLSWPAAEAAASGVPEAIATQVARWPADFADLHVADGVVSATWRLPDREPRSIPAARVRELVEALHGVLATLSPDAGPYR